MIILGIMDVFLKIFDLVLMSLPNIELEIQGTQQLFIDYTNMIMNNLGLIDLVAPLNLFKTCLVASLVLLMGKWTWGIIMFIIRKIPFVSLR